MMELVDMSDLSPGAQQRESSNLSDGTIYGGINNEEDWQETIHLFGRWFAEAPIAAC